MISCERVQAALSARLDGEPGGLDDDVVDAHLDWCTDCQRFVEQSASFNRRLRVGEAQLEPVAPVDLSEVIIAGVEPAWRRHATISAIGRTVSRVLMAFVGALWVLHAITTVRLFALEPEPMTASLYAEAMAMRLALAFGLLFAAWLPRIAGGILPLYGALWTFSFGFLVRDIIVGNLLTSSFVHLSLLSASVAVLAWSWVSEHRWDLRTLGVQPTHL